MKPINVPSFSVDHTDLKAGLYLREDVSFLPFVGYRVWDLRFVTPSEGRYLSGQSLHTIEHIFAYKLREYLGKGYISCFPYGCHTGFGLVTRKGVSEKALRHALVEAIEDVVPIVTKDEIPSLTVKECGRPDYYDIKPSSDWMWEFKNAVINQTQK